MSTPRAQDAIGVMHEVKRLSRIPLHECMFAYWWEIHIEANFKRHPWAELSEQARKDWMRIVGKTHPPVVEETEPKLAYIADYFPEEYRPRNIPVPPKILSQYPHLLHIRWRDYSKTEIQDAIRDWADNVWERVNAKKAKRHITGRSNLLQLAAFRLRRADVPVEDVIASVSGMAGSGSRYDRSWVRRAVREVQRDIDETNQRFCEDEASRVDW